jgi:hypothetical protein
MAKYVNLNKQNAVYKAGGSVDTSSFEVKTVARTGTSISFDAPAVYNSVASPATGNITEDLTGARIGVLQKIYHNDSSEPSYPAGWVNIGSGTYDNSSLNIIYAEWVSGTRVEYWYND